MALAVTILKHKKAGKNPKVDTNFGAFPLRGTLFGTARYGTARFAFPPQFSTALEWSGLFTWCYCCAASMRWHHLKRATNKHTTKGAYRQNCVFHSRHVHVFNSNAEAYKNAWDLLPAAETVMAVPRAVEEEGRDVRCMCDALLE